MKKKILTSEIELAIAKQSFSRKEVMKEYMGVPDECYLHIDVVGIRKIKDTLDYELRFTYAHKSTFEDTTKYNPEGVIFQFEGGSRLGLLAPYEFQIISNAGNESAIN